MADSFQSYKVAANEQSSSTKFNNALQAFEDAINSLDNSNIDAAAAVAVSKLAAGSNGDVLTTVTGIPTWQPPSSVIPAGAVSAYVGTAAPSGWLLCDGTAVSRATYSDLYAVVGTAYGIGDGATTFNLPDMRGRVGVGKGTHTSVDALGDSEGDATVGNRRPQHWHQVNNGTIGFDGDAAQAGSSFTAMKATGSGAYAGSAASPASLEDTPAYLVLNYIVKY